MGSGEFEGQTLEGLHAMLKGSDPAKLAGAGSALSDAGPKIMEIGGYLRGHASRVEWRGEAADYFREWTHEFALEVTRLVHFAGSVGNHMVNAGQALTEAKAAVPKPVDAKKAHGDPDADKALIADGATKLQEAIHQMERLSSYYRAAKEDMGAEREPEFKSLWARGSFESGTPYGTDLPSGVQTPPGTSGVHPASPSAHGENWHREESGLRSVDVERGSTSHVGMGLDGVEGASRVGRDVPSVVVPSGEVVRPSEQGLPVVPGRVETPPVYRGPGFSGVSEVGGRRSPVSSSGSSDGLVGRGRSVVGGERRNLAVPPGVLGGRRQGVGGVSDVVRSSRGLVVGEESVVPGRGVARGGVPSVGSVPPAMGGSPRAGGQSGLQVPHTAASPTAGPSRGIVGEERTGPVRGPLPGGAAGGMPPAGSGGAVGRGSGRRGPGLAVEPGGTAAAPRSGSSRGAGFTPGGAGLVRGTDATSPPQRGQQRSSRDERNSDGLEWPRGRDTVPPAVD